MSTLAMRVFQLRLRYPMGELVLRIIWIDQFFAL